MPLSSRPMRIKDTSVSLFLIGQEAPQPMQDSNTLKRFLNPRSVGNRHGLVKMDYSADISCCPC